MKIQNRTRGGSGKDQKICHRHGWLRAFALERASDPSFTFGRAFHFVIVGHAALMCLCTPACPCPAVRRLRTSLDAPRGRTPLHFGLPMRLARFFYCPKFPICLYPSHPSLFSSSHLHVSIHRCRARESFPQRRQIVLFYIFVLLMWVVRSFYCPFFSSVLAPACPRRAVRRLRIFPAATTDRIPSPSGAWTKRRKSAARQRRA